jgi:pyrimidine-nucleoside phosphorylase
VDKHSTGGVGDKTTLIVAPIAASLGCKVAKMSGRGLGHTGGTVDKLESFPGYDTSLSPEDFLAQVEKIGISVIGQSGNFAPADKKLYALRDVTATVDSIPLITSSIMSKKLAAGSHSIVLDVKCGSGSFMKTPEDARALAEKMVEIGKRNGRNIAALITNMDIPLGHAIGNSLEIKEAVSVLSGEGPDDLRTVCTELATNMVSLSLGIPEAEARCAVKDAITSGKALAKFKEWIIAQGGDESYANDPYSLPEASLSYDVVAEEEGYISKMNAEEIGLASVTLGAGRETKDDTIDFSTGIIVHKKVGEAVKAGDVIATLYTNKESAIASAARTVRGAVTVSCDKPSGGELIYAVIK